MRHVSSVLFVMSVTLDAKQDVKHVRLVIQPVLVVSHHVNWHNVVPVYLVRVDVIVVINAIHVTCVSAVVKHPVKHVRSVTVRVIFAIPVRQGNVVIVLAVKAPVIVVIHALVDVITVSHANLLARVVKSVLYVIKG